MKLLHAKLPHGFAPHVEGSDEYADEIEVPVSWISTDNRNRVRDFERTGGSDIDALRNICRCGTYARIREAIVEGAANM